MVRTQNLNQNTTEAIAPTWSAKLHVRDLRYGATIVVGYTSPALVLNASMTTEKFADFFCSKCAVTRKINPTAEFLTCSRIHTFYTSCNNLAAFAGRKVLKKTSNYSYRQVDNYPNRTKTYTKFIQTRNRFPRLKLQSFRLNEIRSIDRRFEKIVSIEL